jgi:hypothetical protein
MLLKRYLANCEMDGASPAITKDGLRLWYNGYNTSAGIPVYNPLSVINALAGNRLASYWASSGPYEELRFYIEKNASDVRADLALMAAGEPVAADVQVYAATSMSLRNRDEILSAMVVYGLLSHNAGFVRIPNKELSLNFERLLKTESSLGYVNTLAKASKRMLAATLSGDTDTMRGILEQTHDTESPIFSYNSEIELSAIVNLAYLSARDEYEVLREDKAGKGYAGFILFPLDARKDSTILELKVDDTPESAISQIKEKNYPLAVKRRFVQNYSG